MPDKLPVPDRTRVHLLYYFCRMQMPAIDLPPEVCERHLTRTFELYESHARKKERDVSWDLYLDDLYPVDWFLASGCLEGNERAWERLFAARVGRTDGLLMDSLQSKASRIYPRNEERQESAVLEFWSYLYVPPDRAHGLPILARYDGLRPLAPWLIRVFHNYHVSLLRGRKNFQAIPDDDFIPLPDHEPRQDHWHEAFCHAAGEWIETLKDKELLLLGLRLRYQFSQREIADILGVHEGTISRRIDDLSDRWKESISKKMIAQGWSGNDLSRYVRTEMRNLLFDDFRMSADHLAELLAAQGKSLPEAATSVPE